jgi:hypothetical protein
MTIIYKVNFKNRTIKPNLSNELFQIHFNLYDRII